MGLVSNDIVEFEIARYSSSLYGVPTSKIARLK
jgi:hypothetical protein